MRSVEHIVADYVYLSVQEMFELLALASRHALAAPIEGFGIELGAGCGLLSAVVASMPNVRAVLAVEICQRMPELVIPKVAAEVLGGDARKVVPVVGSFDDLRMPDASLDFAVEIDSLHHSDDLSGTLRECARVLRPGGQLLCFDRCHPDSITDEQVEAMLSRTYDRSFLLANCYPPETVLTRRENGEHEYRLFEWKAACDAAGLRLERIASFSRRVPARAALKGALSILPTPIKRHLGGVARANLGATRQWLEQRVWLSWRSRWRGHIFAPKETTVFVMRKPGRA